jgi:ABC-type uncharacterized transport system substrate-binding protein
MSGRIFVWLLATFFLGSVSAEAQSAGRNVTIGYLGNSSPSLESSLVEAFREGLRQLGYVEGQNLVIRYQWAEGQQERQAVLAQELVRLRPESSSLAAPQVPLRPSKRRSQSLSSPR